MKRSGKFLVSIICSFCFIFGLASCREKHTHSYVGDYVPVLKNYYETQVDFFVNPVKETSSSQIINGTYGENVMSLVSTLLNQDVFLEQLLLSENGVAHPYIKNYFGIPTGNEFTLNDLRENSGYNALINKVNDSISVFYDENVTSFIYVSISVLEDKDFAEFLYNQICEKVPPCLENSLPLPTGYDRTVCQKTSRADEIKLVQKIKKRATLDKTSVARKNK